VIPEFDHEIYVPVEFTKFEVGKTAGCVVMA
jgi:hypothetical protein